MSTAAAPKVRVYLEHMLQACTRIRRYSEDMTEPVFLEDELVQDGVMRNIEILGEAARNIQRHFPAFAADHADIPWEDIYWMRNRLSHGYFSVDLEIVWRTVQRDIPELEQQILLLLQPSATSR
jgi:uncharacterized protein with HEPN domain